MTVLGDARPIAAGHPRLLPRFDAVPRRAAPLAGARPLGPTRRRVGTRSRAGLRSHPFGIVLAFVFVGLLVGLIYVAQTVRLAATTIDIETLTAERDDLARQIQTIESSVLRWGTESTVLEHAQRLELGQLETRVRLPAR